MVEVFDVFESVIEIFNLNITTNTYSKSNGGTVDIDNVGLNSYLPKIKVTFNNSETIDGTFIENGSQQINISSLSVVNTDVLVLDFEKQNYTLNGNSIINSISFPNNTPLEITEGEVNTLTFYPTNTVSIDIDELTMGSANELHYVEDYSFKSGVDRKKKQIFNSSESRSYKIKDKTHNFTITKMMVDEDFKSKLESNEKFVIRETKFNPDTSVTTVDYYTGITIDDVNEENKMGEFVKLSIQGQATTKL